jgi:hypothetical protein
VHTEDKVAHCAAQHLAWLVTHLAQFVVLIIKILFVEDHPGRRLGSLGLLLEGLIKLLFRSCVASLVPYVAVSLVSVQA